MWTRSPCSSRPARGSRSTPWRRPALYWACASVQLASVRSTFVMPPIEKLESTTAQAVNVRWRAARGFILGTDGGDGRSGRGPAALGPAGAVGLNLDHGEGSLYTTQIVAWNDGGTLAWTYEWLGPEILGDWSSSTGPGSAELVIDGATAELTIPLDDVLADGVPDELRIQFLLYDLVADPWVVSDVGADHPEVRRRMIADLTRYYEELPRYDVGAASRVEISQEQIERLKALGYLQ